MTIQMILKFKFQEYEQQKLNNIENNTYSLKIIFQSCWFGRYNAYKPC